MTPLSRPPLSPARQRGFDQDRTGERGREEALDGGSPAADPAGAGAVGRRGGGGGGAWMDEDGGGSAVDMACAVKLNSGSASDQRQRVHAPNKTFACGMRALRTVSRLHF